MVYFIKQSQFGIWNVGYDVHIHHVEVSNEESMNRSVARAIETGRYIPLEKINSYGDKPKEVYEQLKKKITGR